MTQRVFDDILGFLYETAGNDDVLFGARWVGPERLVPYETTLAARFPKTGGDGQDVDVFVSAAPARFYTVSARDGTDSVGRPKAGFGLSTGSGGEMGRLAIKIAEAIAGGMLSLDDQPGAAGTTGGRRGQD